MTDRELLALVVVGLPALAAVLLALAPHRLMGCPPGARLRGPGRRSSGWRWRAGALADPEGAEAGTWIVVDAAGGLLVAAIALVGLASVLVSPAALRTLPRSLVQVQNRDRTYYVVLYAFWSILLAVPLAGNLGAAWLLVEATAATSAILVGFSGKPRALEAAWKYLILTSLGLGVALLGIVLLAAGSPPAGSTASPGESCRATTAAGHCARRLPPAPGRPRRKIGWAPVHNWLPDAPRRRLPRLCAPLRCALARRAARRLALD